MIIIKLVLSLSLYCVLPTLIFLQFVSFKAFTFTIAASNSAGGSQDANARSFSTSRPLDYLSEQQRPPKYMHPAKFFPPINGVSGTTENAANDSSASISELERNVSHTENDANSSDVSEDFSKNNAVITDDTDDTFVCNYKKFDARELNLSNLDNVAERQMLSLEKIGEHVGQIYLALKDIWTQFQEYSTLGFKGKEIEYPLLLDVDGFGLNAISDDICTIFVKMNSAIDKYDKAIELKDQIIKLYGKCKDVENLLNKIGNESAIWLAKATATVDLTCLNKKCMPRHSNVLQYIYSCESVFSEIKNMISLCVRHAGLTV